MPSPEPAAAGLSLRHAVALGALHGPAELLPISSSGHVTLVPWLLGWPYAGLDGELRKSFEVALHAGTAAALLIALRGEVAEAARTPDRRRVVLVVLSFVPPAVAGYTLERPIEQRLGTPASIAAGLLAGSAAMAAADRFGPVGRAREEAGALDALLLGAAQACALIPGASRNGMTLAAARARGFDREDANALSRHVALPIILGATALKGTRMARRLAGGDGDGGEHDGGDSDTGEPLPPGLVLRIAAGAAASFASTLGSTWLIRQVERDRSLAPYAAYRTALAAVVLRRVWQHRGRADA